MADPIQDFHTRWIVKEHIIPASHIRGYARGVRDDTDGNPAEQPLLRLAVKQYIPRSNPSPRPGDPTIILAHGVGSSKESYEPFVDALLHPPRRDQASSSSSPSPPPHAPPPDQAAEPPLRIRAVWIPDLAWHGASYRLNAAHLGDSPDWDDAARDLLHLANHLGADGLLPPPVLGVSQSWGAYALLRAAAFHPRLFAGLALLEPTTVSHDPTIDGSFGGSTFRGGGGQRKSFAYGMIFKRDTWPSREAARAYLRRNPYYGAFDPAVFERVMRYDLREVDDDDSGAGGGVSGGGTSDRGSREDDNGSSSTNSTITTRSTAERAVTLTTPKSMEVYTMMRSWPPSSPSPSSPASSPYADPDHRLHALAQAGRYRPNPGAIEPGFHRPEPTRLARDLPHIRPPVVLVWADGGFARLTGYRAWLRESLGVGPEGGGGAGAAEGEEKEEGQQQVREVVVAGSGHPLPLERPAEAAAAVAPWLGARARAWAEEAERERERVKNGARHFIDVVHPEWVEKASKL